MNVPNAFFLLTLLLPLLTHPQVQETSWFTRSARQVMNNMHLRAIRHKACLILIIVFQFILIGIVFNYGVLARYRKKD